MKSDNASLILTPDREPMISLILYRLFKWSMVSPFFHTYFRGNVHGSHHVPQRGKLLVVSNHASDFDPPFVASGVGRPVAFMAKEELFRVPVLKQAIAAYGAYPVKRGSADRSAMKSAVASIENGWATGIFLDGTRMPDGRIHDPKIGAAWIAAKTQSPILPVCLWGSHEIFRSKSGEKLSRPRSVPLTLRIGPPIAPPESSDRAALEAVTAHCAAVINQMHDLGR
jgi:1-acyl-sn-glycerol-3-phosphate acyltransferase